eukprot:807981-Alexandrium_andersonii.AAC.1
MRPPGRRLGEQRGSGGPAERGGDVVRERPRFPKARPLLQSCGARRKTKPAVEVDEAVVPALRPRSQQARGRGPSTIIVAKG